MHQTSVIPESRAVVGQDDQLSFSLTDHLLGLLVAQDVFSTLHHQLEPGVDGLHRLFLKNTDKSQVSDSKETTLLISIYTFSPDNEQYTQN